MLPTAYATNGNLHVGLYSLPGYAHGRFLRQVCVYSLTRATGCGALSIEVFKYYRIAATDFLFLQSRHAYSDIFRSRNVNAYGSVSLDYAYS